jgi:hypothetical protein
MVVNLTPASHPPTIPSSVNAASIALSVLGLVGLLFAAVRAANGAAVTRIVGVETTTSVLMALSGMLLFAMHVAVLCHLWATRALTRAEKRVWLNALISPAGGYAAFLYMTSPDLAAAARREGAGHSSVLRI